MHYYLFRVHGDHFRMERAPTVEEACQLAFGTVFRAPYNGSVVYKDVGTKSPNYVPQKIKQQWYRNGGWSVIGADVKGNVD